MSGSCSSDCPRHHCHAWHCRVHVDPSMLMCRRHWWMVPPKLRAAVWRTYRPGQERDKKPSKEYLTAMVRAIAAVADREYTREQIAKKEQERRQLLLDEAFGTEGRR